MSRTDLKKLIRECLVEILSEDFINRVIKESVSERLVIEINAKSPMSSSSQERVPRKQKQQPLQEGKKSITPELREKMRKAVAGDEDFSLDNPTSSVIPPNLNPKVVAAVDGIQNPLFKELAQDTLNRVGTKKEEMSSFNDQEKQLIDIEKIAAINDALPK